MTEFINWAVNYLLFPLELLIACVLYMLPLEKRRNFPLRVILGILACLALAAFIPRSLLRYLLPHYRQEGKRQLTIAIGCTGGRHPSVAIAEAIY